jgi:hypothetical protein
MFLEKRIPKDSRSVWMPKGGVQFGISKKGEMVKVA